MHLLIIASVITIFSNFFIHPMVTTQYRTEIKTNVHYATLYQQLLTILHIPITKPYAFYNNIVMQQRLKEAIQHHGNSHGLYQQLQTSADWHAFFGYFTNTEPIFMNHQERSRLFLQQNYWKHQSYRSFLNDLHDAHIHYIKLFETLTKNPNHQLHTVLLDDKQTVYSYVKDKITSLHAHEWLDFFQKKYAIYKPLNQWSAQQRITLFAEAINLLSACDPATLSLDNHGLVKLLALCTDYESTLATLPNSPIVTALRNDSLKQNFKTRLRAWRAEYQQYAESRATVHYQKAQERARCTEQHKHAKTELSDLNTMWKARYAVLERYAKSNPDNATRNYHYPDDADTYISPDGLKLLEHGTINKEVSSCSGDIIQQHLYTELSALANSAGALRSDPLLFAFFADHLAMAAQSIASYKLTQACAILDFCWSALSYLKGNFIAFTQGCLNFSTVYMGLCIDALNTYSHTILNGIRTHLEGYSPQHWIAYACTLCNVKHEQHLQTHHWQLLAEKLYLYQFKHFITALKERYSAFHATIHTFYQYLVDKEPSALAQVSALAPHDRGAFLGVLATTYHNECVSYAACAGALAHESPHRSALSTFSALYQKFTRESQTSSLCEQPWQEQIAHSTGTRPGLCAEFVPDAHTSPKNPYFVLPIEYEHPRSAPIASPRIVAHHSWYLHNRHAWKPFVYTSKEILLQLRIGDVGIETLRSFITTIFGVSFDQLTAEHKGILFGALHLYDNNAFMQLLRSIPDCNLYFVEMALLKNPKEWPDALHIQLKGMTEHDWTRVIEIGAKKLGLSSQQEIIRHYGNYLSCYQFSAFKACLQRYADFKNHCIDLALSAHENQHLNKNMNTLFDAQGGTIAQRLKKELNTVSISDMKTYCVWKYGTSLETLSSEQKKELFTRWSLWSSYGYHTLLRATPGFDSFVMETAHNQAIIKKLRQYQSLDGHGTIADHIRSLAKGAHEAYAGCWENYSLYNGPRAVRVHELTSEERYALYQDPVFVLYKDAAQYLASFGQEHENHLQRLAYELDHNATLQQQFSELKAFDGNSADKYLRQEAQRAQDRIDQAKITATQKLTQQVYELNQIKNEYLFGAEQPTCLPTVRERLLQRAQAIETFVNGDHSISVRDYYITQEAKQLIRTMGMREYLLERFTGNVIQHQIHGELVSIINEAGVLKNAATGKTLSADQLAVVLNDFTSYISDYAHIAHDYNCTALHSEKAWAINDVCWGLIDCTYAALQGIGDGIGNTLLHIKDFATDPIASAKRYAESTGNLALAMLRAWCEIEAVNIAFEVSPELGEEKVRDVVNNITAMCNALYAEIKDLPPRDMVRGVAAIATEAYLGNRVRTVTHKFLNTAKEKAVVFAQKIGEKLTNKSPILQTPDGMQVRVADKMTKYHHERSAKKQPRGEVKKDTLTPKTVPTYTYKNGKYVDAKYHHTNSKGPQSAGRSEKGIKSRAPKDGQAALDNSVQVKNKGHFDRRVGTSNGEIVILDGSIQQDYHGHVRTWEDLFSDKDAKPIIDALKEYGFIDKKGNVIK